MAPVDDERPSGTPGERRLDRPPSERYSEPADTTDDGNGRRVPPIVAGAIVALVGALVITIGGGLLAITAGLIVVAAALGWAVAAAMAAGHAPRTARTMWSAVGLAVLGVGLGQVGLWLLARQEGGVLGIVDYLAETFGFLVPLELVAAAVAAWWRAR
jgi:MFS family permease